MSVALTKLQKELEKAPDVQRQGARKMAIVPVRLYSNADGDTVINPVLRHVGEPVSQAQATPTSWQLQIFSNPTTLPNLAPS